MSGFTPGIGRGGTLSGSSGGLLVVDSPGTNDNLLKPNQDSKMCWNDFRFWVNREGYLYGYVVHVTESILKSKSMINSYFLSNVIYSNVWWYPLPPFTLKVNNTPSVTNTNTSLRDKIILNLESLFSSI